MELSDSVTEWLRLWRAGDDLAIAHVTDLVYRDLRRVAAYHLSGESNAATLSQLRSSTKLTSTSRPFAISSGKIAVNSWPSSLV